MSESNLHKLYKQKFAGKTGGTEYRLPSGRRIDAVSPTGIFTEIELDGAPRRIVAVNKLKESQDIGVARKVRLVVPDQNLDSAYREMRRQRVGGEVLTPDMTTRIYVPKRRKSTR